jgi:hypothetical protein
MVAGTRTRLAMRAVVVLLLFVPVSGMADSFEPNDAPAAATPFENGIEVESWISTDEDLDWYRLDVYQDGSITARLHDLPADYDLVLFWKNPMTERVETREGWRSDNPGVEEEVISLDPQGIGTFYLLVFGFSGAADTEDSYLLSATWPAGGPSDPPVTAVLIPNGGEVWPAGSFQTIRFQAHDLDTEFASLIFRIDYSTNSGLSWFNVYAGTLPSAVYRWAVPDVETSRARVRVSVSDGWNVVSDTSDADFTVAAQAPSVTVIQPNGGEHLSAGYSEDVVFVATDPDTPAGELEMTFEFSTDSGASWNRIGIYTFPNTGEFNWLTLPFLSTMNARLRVIASDGVHHGSDDSDADFSITQPPDVYLSSPTGRERWDAGSDHPITYRADDGDTDSNELVIDIEYTTDGGTAWLPIATGQANSGSYVWTVPDTPTSSALVRVWAFDGLLKGSDRPGQFFTIRESAGVRSTLTVQGASVQSGETVALPLDLDNLNYVTRIRTDLEFDPEVVSYLEGSASGRAESMSYEAQVIEPGKLHVELAGTEGRLLLPGAGEVARIQFSAVGTPGTSTALSPVGTEIFGAQGQAIGVTGVPGSIHVTEWPRPDLRLRVLRNPGRTRSIQIFVSADLPLMGVHVLANEQEVAMTQTPRAPEFYSGTIDLPADSRNVHIQARGSTEHSEGLAATMIEF